MWFASRRRMRTSSPTPTTGTARRPANAPFRLRLEALDARDLPSFLTPVNYPVGSQQAIAVGDFNNDGHPDIVTTTSGDMGTSQFTLLLAGANKKGQSLGQFQVGTTGYKASGESNPTHRFGFRR
jgi:hypothetical protein